MLIFLHSMEEMNTTAPHIAIDLKKIDYVVVLFMYIVASGHG